MMAKIPRQAARISASETQSHRVSIIHNLRIYGRQLWQHPAIKFLGVGGLSTIVQFALLTAFVESGVLPEVAASAVSYLLSAAVNYLLNYHLTFASNKKHSETLPKFVGVVGVGATVNTLVFALANGVLPWYWLSQCIATVVSTVANYVLHKVWIYRQPR